MTATPQQSATDLPHRRVGRCEATRDDRYLVEGTYADEVILSTALDD